MDSSKNDSRELTVFFADIVNSTPLYQRRGDAQAHRLITDCLKQMKAIVEGNGGVLLRTVGDAVLASFVFADDAFNAAIVAQQQLADSSLSIRVGFHYGEVIPDGGDVYGNAVNIAARVASFANSNEIYTTGDTIERLESALRSKAQFLDRIELKGIQQPLPVYRVNWSNQVESSSQDTRIATSISASSRYRTNVFLDVHVGAERFRVDENNTSLTIGRTDENDIVIEHPSTSRQHAIISYQKARYTLLDTSTNGTFIERIGQDAVFLRRESTVLSGDGVIGVGWQPSSDEQGCVVFRSVVDDS